MRKKSWLSLIPALPLSLCLVLIGCGKGYDDDEDSQQNEEVVAQYHASLTPLNSKVGKYSGKLSITINENQFWARMIFRGPKTGSMNFQSIHFGSRCPSIQDDLNQDGYLDFIEAHAVVGDILIPLDSVLESQLKGMNLFPKLRKDNSYYYSEAANFTRIMDDIRGEDFFPDDKMGKLKNENLNLDSRVVLVYGVNEERRLPNTVTSYNGYPAQASLPIACGVVVSLVDPNGFSLADDAHLTD